MGMQVYKPSCVRFSPSADVLVAGDDSGSVVVYKITGVDTTVYSHKDQIDRLEKALAAKDAADDQH